MKSNGNLLKGFYHQWATMTIVGDDAHRIFIHGADHLLILFLNFHNNIPRVKDYQLCMNYRSTGVNCNNVRIQLCDLFQHCLLKKRW